MTVEPQSSERHGVGFWFAVVLGAGFMVVGVLDYLDATPDFERRANFAAFVIGADVAHDFLLAPIACFVGWIVWRACPRVVWAPVRFGLIASASLLVIALPGLRETADVSQNPTIQPLNYATGFATVLAVVWIIAALWALIVVVAARARGQDQ